MCISLPTAVRFLGTNSVRLLDSTGEVFVVSVFAFNYFALK